MGHALLLRVARAARIEEGGDVEHLSTKAGKPPGVVSEKPGGSSGGRPLTLGGRMAASAPESRPSRLGDSGRRQPCGSSIARGGRHRHVDIAPLRSPQWRSSPRRCRPVPPPRIRSRTSRSASPHRPTFGKVACLRSAPRRPTRVRTSRPRAGSSSTRPRRSSPRLHGRPGGGTGAGPPTDVRQRRGRRRPGGPEPQAGPDQGASPWRRPDSNRRPPACKVDLGRIFACYGVHAG